VARRVDDDLLARERGIEVGDDADGPPGRVGRRAVRATEGQRLGRRALLPPFAERAGLELLGRRVLDRAEEGARPARAAGCDDDGSPRERVAAKLAAQEASPPEPPPFADSPRSMKARKSSIGSGRMIVDERSLPISSIVCRKRS
jgi:hypothetical protein